MKKLKIQFWKAEKAIAMQILEQEGLPKGKGDGFIKIMDSPALDFKMGVWLRGYHSDSALNIETISLNSNTERDAYLKKAVNAITDELFTGGRGLKSGEICEVRDHDIESWSKRKLITILPEQYDKRFITEWKDYPDKHKGWSYARPLNRTEPTVEEYGDVVTYTWEEQ